MTTLPTIHLNGTGKQMLLQGYIDALHALKDAEEAMRKIEFNARDYYPQGSLAWGRATDERFTQFAKLKEIEEHLTEIALHISNAGRD
jgi:hypothetical protein